MSCVRPGSDSVSYVKQLEAWMGGAGRTFAVTFCGLWEVYVCNGLSGRERLRGGERWSGNGKRRGLALTFKVPGLGQAWTCS